MTMVRAARRAGEAEKSRTPAGSPYKDIGEKGESRYPLRGSEKTEARPAPATLRFGHRGMDRMSGEQLRPCYRPA